MEHAACRSSHFIALGHSFAVETNIAPLRRYIDEIFGALAAPGRASSVYSLIEFRPSTGDGAPARFAVHHGDQRVTDTEHPAAAFDALLWHINQMAISSAQDRLVFHAGGVAIDGAAVLIPGRSGAGKSTLVAALVDRGLAYLTDEAVAIDTTTLVVDPYPKPIGLEPGSHALLGSLRPDVPDDVAPFVGRRWLVDARTAGNGGLGRATTPRWMFAPRVVDGETCLTRLGDAEAVMALGENWFNAQGSGQPELEAVVRLARSMACFRIDVNGVEDASSAILAVVADRWASSA